MAVETKAEIKANAKADEALSYALVRLSRGDIFFSTLAFYLNPQIIEQDWLESACTDGAQVWIRRKFFLHLKPKERVALLKHEIMHVAFEHAFRRGERNPRRWNIACDYVINLIIKEEGGALPPGGLCDDQYRGLIEEEVYARLPQGIENSLEFMLDLQDGEQDNPAADACAARQDKVRGLILQAAQATRMTQGTLPGAVARYLDVILKPEQDWRTLLAEYLTALEKSDYDWMRPNRRNSVLDVFLPGMNQLGALEHVAIVVDTSGSIGEAELARFIGETLGVVEVCFPRCVSIIPCDARVYPPLVFDMAPTVAEVMEQLKTGNALKGGGGTNMPVALDWIENSIFHQELSSPPAVVLVMTDGYTACGPARDYPVIWCITTAANVVADPPWGRVVRLKI
jgi:predicted metal-dependent peptidase